MISMSTAELLAAATPYNMVTEEGSMLRLLFIVLLPVAGFTQTGGQQVNVWIPRGPKGGRIGRPVIDPQNPGTIYASVGARLYKTTDAAGHWSDLGVPAVTILAVDPGNSGTLYGANNNTLYKSTDGGLTWSKPGPGLPAPCGPVSSSFVIDPSKTSTLYAGCQGTNQNGGGGLFKSTDGGASWAKLALDGPTALAIDPQDSDTLYAATIAGQLATTARLISSGVRKSMDGGRSWSGVNTVSQSYGISSLTVDPTNSSVVYAQTGGVDCSDSYICDVPGYWDPNSDAAKKGFGLFRSADGGITWAKLDLPVDSFQSGFLGIDPEGTLYSQATAGLVRSMDGGATWNVLPTAGLSSGVSVLAFDPQNPNHLFAGTYGGVFEITLEQH
jgi:photosystem II stability/assembly factor-like uncharacterized protein